MIVLRSITYYTVWKGQARHLNSYSTQAVLRAVCELGRTAAKPARDSQVGVSFYAVLACEVVAAAPRVTEKLVAALAQYLQQGLAPASAPSYRAATYMIIAQLLSHATLSEILLTSAHCSSYICVDSCEPACGSRHDTLSI